MPPNTRLQPTRSASIASPPPLRVRLKQKPIMDGWLRGTRCLRWPEEDFMERVVSATEARIRFGELMRRVAENRETVVAVRDNLLWVRLVE